MHLRTCVDEVSEQRDICRAVDMAPHVPIAGAAAVSTFYEKLQADLLFPDDLFASNAIVAFPSFPFSFPLGRRIARKCGAPFVIRGPGCLLRPRSSRWMKVGNRRMESGRNCGRREELNHCFKGLARFPGFLSVAVVLREEFTIARRKMTVFLGNGS